MKYPKNIMENEDNQTEKFMLVGLQKRALAFLLDYGFLIGIMYYSHQIMVWIDNEVSDLEISIMIGLYCLLFVVMERKFDGSCIKRKLKIKSLSIDGEKLGFHIYALKLILRPMAFITAAIFLNYNMISLLWIKGDDGVLIKFFRGDYYSLWYDHSIGQMTVKLIN